MCQVKVLLSWGFCRDLAVATMEGSPQAPALMAAQGPVKASTAVTVDSPCVLQLGPGTRAAEGNRICRVQLCCR